MRRSVYTELAYREAEHEGRRIQVAAVYKGLFGRPFPKGWEAEFGLVGITSYEQKVVYYMQRTIEQDPVTFVHELVHVRHPKWNHGKKFQKEVRRLVKRLLDSDLIDKERL